VQRRQRLPELAGEPVALRRRDVGPGGGQRLAVQALHDDVAPALQLAGVLHPWGGDRQLAVDGLQHMVFDLVAVLVGAWVELEHQLLADGVDRQRPVGEPHDVQPAQAKTVAERGDTLPQPRVVAADGQVLLHGVGGWKQGLVRHDVTVGRDRGWSQHHTAGAGRGCQVASRTCFRSRSEQVEAGAAIHLAFGVS
jgi:hypothetical protein